MEMADDKVLRQLEPPELPQLVLHGTSLTIWRIVLILACGSINPEGPYTLQLWN